MQATTYDKGLLVDCGDKLSIYMGGAKTRYGVYLNNHFCLVFWQLFVSLRSNSLYVIFRVYDDGANTDLNIIAAESSEY